MSSFSVTGKLLWIFDVFMFPSIFMILEVLHCFFYIWSRSHFLQFLLTAFRVKISFISPAIDSKAFSELARIHLLLAPSFLRILKFLCLLLILQCTIMAASCLSFVFLKVMLQFICGFSLSCRVWSAFCFPCLLELSLTNTLRSVIRELSTEWRKVCVCHIMCSGFNHRPVGKSVGIVSLQLVGRLSDGVQSIVSRNPVVPSGNFICHAPNLLPPLAGKARHSVTVYPFPLWEKSWAV